MSSFANTRMAEIFENLQALSPEKIDSFEQPPLEIAAFILVSLKLAVATALLDARVPPEKIGEVMRQVNEGLFFLDPRFKLPENRELYARCADIYKRDLVDSVIAKKRGL